MMMMIIMEAVVRLLFTMQFPTVYMYTYIYINHLINLYYEFNTTTINRRIDHLANVVKSINHTRER